MKKVSYNPEARKPLSLSKKPETEKPLRVSNLSETDNLPDKSQSSRYRRPVKSLEELNMLDAFLFKASTEKVQNAEFIARIIIERATGRKVDQIVVETEKPLSGIDIDRRGIRLDLCISEMKHKKLARVYDIEPNNYDIDKLPKRDRFYQSMLDVKFLESGQQLDELPELISIWILPQDPFGDNRMIYTVKNVVEENNELLYNDGVKKYFLYTNGKYGGSKELMTLLKYMSSTSAADAVDEELEKLHKVVDEVKHSREVGERYMTLQDLIDVEKDRSYQEGQDYMKNVMQDIIDVEKDRSYQEGQDYMKNVMQDIIDVEKDRSYQEGQDYMKNVMQDIIDVEKDRSYQEGQDYMKNVMQDIIDAEKDRSYQEGQDYMKNVMQDIIDVEKDRSYQEGQDYMKNVMQDIIDVEKDRSYQEGREAGIRVLVSTCKGFGQDDSSIKAALIREYSLSEEEAEKYLN